MDGIWEDFHEIPATFLQVSFACGLLQKVHKALSYASLLGQGMKKAFESLCTEKVLQLKVGSSVMLLINKRLPNKCRTQAERPFSLPSLNPMVVMPDTFRETPLVNGSIGVVVAFEKSEDDADGVEYPVVEFAGRERVLITPFVQSGEFGHHGQYAARLLEDQKVSFFCCCCGWPPSNLMFKTMQIRMRVQRGRREDRCL